MIRWAKRPFRLLWIWLLPHEGKWTCYATKDELPTAKDRNDLDFVDSVLVRSQSPQETLPDRVYDLSVPDTSRLFREAERVISDERPKYHVLRNNCSTLIAGVFRAAGIDVPPSRLMSPRKLEKWCVRNLVKYKTGFPLPDRMSVERRFRQEDGEAKRILTLDGGGVRGAVSIGILARIEDILADQWKESTGRSKEEFRLCHYFDCIVGTSTGAIIAVLLASGMRVTDVKKHYLSLAAKVFSPRPSLRAAWLLQKLTSRGIYPRRVLIGLIAEALAKIEGWTDGNCPLGDAPLKTGVGVVVRCLDADHTWFVHNNRQAKFYSDNASTPLAAWVRASTAAPPYFKPELIECRGKKRAFADGGISAFCNPALAAFVVATLRQVSKTGVQRGFGWKPHHRSLMIVSVGTGWLKQNKIGIKIVKGWRPILLKLWAPMMTAFLRDSNFVSQGMLLWMSTSKTRRMVHGMAEDFSDETPAREPLLTYLRYDVELHGPDTYGDLVPGDPESEKQAEERGRRYYNFTNGKNVRELLKIGELAGCRQVLEDHFEAHFKPKFWIDLTLPREGRV